jgi:hypothetical protein
VSVQYQATNTALQASTQLLLLEVSTGRQLQTLRQPSVLLPPSVGGYLLLALCEPLVDVPAGSWSLSLTSDRKLPPLTELPCSRQVAFSGVYAPNIKAVLSRCVIHECCATRGWGRAQCVQKAGSILLHALNHTVAAIWVSCAAGLSSIQRPL